jgi:hypothetical protein
MSKYSDDFPAADAMYKQYVDAAVKKREEVYADNKFQEYKLAAYKRIQDANDNGHNRVSIATFQAGDGSVSAFTEALCTLLIGKGYYVDGPGGYVPVGAGAGIAEAGDYFSVSWQEAGSRPSFMCSGYRYPGAPYRGVGSRL